RPSARTPATGVSHEASSIVAFLHDRNSSSLLFASFTPAARSNAHKKRGRWRISNRELQFRNDRRTITPGLPTERFPVRLKFSVAPCCVRRIHRGLSG